MQEKTMNPNPHKLAKTELGLLMEALRYPKEHFDILRWVGISGACVVCFVVVHVFV
jgi:hypothetical protein